MDGVKGNGEIKSETRQVGAFSAIAASGAYRLEVSHGPRRLELRSDANLLPLVETSVDGGRLVLRTRKNLRPTDGVTVTVATPELRRLAISGAVKGHVDGVSGEGFDIELSGAGSLDVTGQVERLGIHLSGAGRIRAQGLRAEEAGVRCSGAGSIELQATRTLDVVLSGAGRVAYHGDPKVTQKISGVGSLVKK